MQNYQELLPKGERRTLSKIWSDILSIIHKHLILSTTSGEATVSIMRRLSAPRLVIKESTVATQVQNQKKDSLN